MATPQASHASKKVAVTPNESELVPFDHSAAGHEGISSNASGSLIIKPCTQAEIDFYESAKDHPLFQAHMPTFIGSLSQHEDQDAVAPLLEASHHGVAAPAGVIADPTPGLIKRATWKPSGGKKLSTGTAIVLENVASGFKHPNVLDVKLGSRLWDDEAPLAKRRKLDEVAEGTTSGSLGFRVAGMKIWAGITTPEDHAKVAPAEKEYVEVKNGYKSYNKFYGQSFKAENVVDAFTAYFGGAEESDGDKKVKFRQKRAEFIVRRFIRELESIQYVLENEESRMYSASVLMVYEGDEEALEESIAREEKEDGKAAAAGHEDGVGDEDVNEDEDDDDDDDDEQDTKPHKIHEVRLIDFAHARWTPGEGPDENALKGIRSVLGVLRNLVD
ncbi:arginine metabolism regulation protein iii [Cladophialophora carrionii]|uniref:Kinase n=1 Tax=Cladophialophora carrionii TaxID=86049 RepID=A0A1C1C798_9EURO|nr:arginine metabolism regulation protein iii [Cladophialophora carrionii]